jgi:uncharacterized protein involved in exopolysaccharide biosynthesis
VSSVHFSVNKGPVIDAAEASPRRTIPDSEEGEPSILGFVNVLLRYRGQIFISVLACLTAALTLALISPARYTVHGSFAPQSRRSTSSLSAMAVQLGLNLPGGDAGQSPAFYADLVKSRTILYETVQTRYNVPTAGGPRSGTLVDFYEISGPTAAARLEQAVRKLSDDVSASLVQRTGVVLLSVTTEYPALSYQVAQRVLDLVNRFNLESRQSQAGAERRFTAARLGEARRELRSAEDQLQSFLQRNRGYSDSPELRFQAERLQREVMMRQQVYTTLTQAFEQARIEEVRDTPVITVIDTPLLPSRADSRRLPLMAVLGILLGVVLGVTTALVRAVVTRSRETKPSAFEEFVTLRHEAATDVRHPIRALRRALTRRPHRTA